MSRPEKLHHKNDAIHIALFFHNFCRYRHKNYFHFQMNILQPSPMWLSASCDYVNSNHKNIVEKNCPTYILLTWRRKNNEYPLSTNREISIQSVHVVMMGSASSVASHTIQWLHHCGHTDTWIYIMCASVWMFFM